eukprot:sb/3462120/
MDSTPISSYTRPSGKRPRKKPSAATISTVSKASTSSTADPSTSFSSEDIVTTTTDPGTTSFSTSDQSFLSLIFFQGTLGAAFYDTEHCVLNIFKEISECGDFQNILRMCYQCSPDKGNSAAVEVVPASFFVYELSKRRLLNLAPSGQSETTNDHKDIWVSSVVNLDDKNSVKAAGALLRYIDQNRIGIELEESFIQAPILGVAQVSLMSSLYLDSNTLYALQIFQDENHPSAAKRGRSRGKEGLSLFGNMNRTKSRLGSIRLKHWFRTPSRDINLIRQRQEAIQFFTLNENLDKVLAISDWLRSVKNITKIFAKMVASHISVQDWQILYKTLFSALCITDMCSSITDEVEIVQDFRNIDLSGLREVLAMVNKIMDVEESKLKNRFVVKYGIDIELDEKKRVYNGLPELMTSIAEQELADLDPRIAECSVIYLPQLGYLVSVPIYPFLTEENQYALQNLEFVFATSDAINYKSERTKELDRLLGDTQSEISDHESGIMHRLQNMVLQHMSPINTALDFVAELDCLISIASFSKDHDLVFPTITPEKQISIVGGRHILHELCTRQFVPNDTYLDPNNGLLTIISGPNASGKSVYLKQVALITYMAHLGSAVPATSADICVCDSIFTRIKCVESVSVNLSTFMLDLNQITKAVNGATSRSLVIMDEFGKGTSRHNGIALFTATMRHWLARVGECPFVLAATHYHTIFHRRLLPPSPILRYKTFDIGDDGSGGLVYLFKLIDGYCLHSRATNVARLAGIDQSIVDRADEILSLTATEKQPPQPDSVKDNNFENCQTVVKRFLETNFEFEESSHEFISWLKSNLC